MTMKSTCEEYQCPCHDKVAALEAGIRRHRDYRGDDRCHLDDGELYALLPEGDTRPTKDTAVTLENCRKFIECRVVGREYVSPQRRIEQLEANLAALEERLAEADKIVNRVVEAYNGVDDMFDVAGAAQAYMKRYDVDEPTG